MSEFLRVVAAVPQQPQRQDSLDDQLRDLYIVAIRFGCNDAADWLRRIGERNEAGR